MAGIFISYRRDDSAGWTGRLSTDLQERFGQEAVFQDIGAIEAGEDFIHAIERSLASCSVVLVVIGPAWSVIKDQTGARRLDNSDDTVRLEIAKALAQPDRLVIPVLVGGTRMPAANELPPDLKALAHRNAFELSDTRWNYDLEQLTASLIKRAGLPPTARTVSPGPKPTRRLIAFSSGIIVLVGLLAGYWYFMIQETSTSPLERDSRGATVMNPKKLNVAELVDLKQRVSRLQAEFFPLLQSDLDRAEANATQTLTELDLVAPSYPDDVELQNLQAYALKNYAMVMQVRGKPEEFKRALDTAETTFKAILQQKPDDAGAWNGLGSVAMLRNDPASALDYIDRALKILPDYDAAKADRTTALQMLKRQKGSGR